MSDLNAGDESGYSWHIATQEEIDAAAEQARPLIEAGKFDEADALVQAVDSHSEAAAALAAQYIAALKRLVASDEVSAAEEKKLRARELFVRALRWRSSSYPDPRSDDMLVAVEQACAQDLRELIGILGYDPQ